MSDVAETLLHQARDGDREAAGQLITLFYERIYAYLRRQCGHDEDAADLTQRTFTKAWTSLGSFAGRSSVSTWLHGIAHHTFLDWRRQQKPVTQPDEAWWESRADDSPGPSAAAAERDLSRHVCALVAQLDDDVRHTVHLHYFQSLSIAETAAVLNIATSTVKYRVRQALDFLRARMAEPKGQPR